MERSAEFRWLFLNLRLWEEIHRYHQAILLRFEGAEFRAFLGIGDPIRVRPKVRPLGFPVACILIGPDVDVLVRIAGLRRHVEQRLAEILRLRPGAQLGVYREVFFDRARTTGIGANVE